MRYKHITILLILFIFFLAPEVSAQTQPIPTGTPIDLTDLLDISENIGGFLMVLGGIVAAIAIILAGIMYLTSGSNPQRVNSAKGMLKGAMIGALIIFSTGIIINTIRKLASDPMQFFK